VPGTVVLRGSSEGTWCESDWCDGRSIGIGIPVESSRRMPRARASVICRGASCRLQISSLRVLILHGKNYSITVVTTYHA
jgi:hypothetical protein